MLINGAKLSSHAQPDLAVLLVAHGTRNPTGIQQTGELFGLIAEMLPHWRGMPVRMYPSFLELAEPSLEEMLSQLLKAGHNAIIVVPIMLFAADHVKRDIPAIVDRVIERHAKAPVRVVITGALGVKLRLVTLSRRRADEALQRAGLSQSDVAYVMVSRGTGDADALGEVQAYFELMAVRSYQHAVLSYLAVAQPRVEDVLPQVAELDVKGVLVQPHLLFEGYLTNHLRQLIEECERRWPERRWLLADVLGPDEIVAQLLVAEIKTALEGVFQKHSLLAPKPEPLVGSPPGQ